VNDSIDELIQQDKGGRRFGIDRRVFSYDSHIPERRKGRDQRNGGDRRTGAERRKVIVFIRQPSRENGLERRSGRDRRVEFG